MAGRWLRTWADPELVPELTKGAVSLIFFGRKLFLALALATKVTHGMDEL
jgi:hypothetical protein